jgi:hypothetical protein
MLTSFISSKVVASTLECLKSNKENEPIDKIKDAHTFFYMDFNSLLILPSTVCRATSRHTSLFGKNCGNAYGGTK